MKKKIRLIGLVSAFALIGHAATNINFTTAEGYISSGLDGQNGWDADAFTVDTTATTVTRTNDWGNAVYNVPLLGSGYGEGDSATAVTDFHFAGTLADMNNTLSANVGFAEGTAKGANAQKFNVGTSQYLNGFLRLRDDLGGEFDPLELGQMALPGADEALRITHTLILGADAASSVMLATLSNLVSGASATASYTGIDSTVYDAATTGSGLYFKFGNGLLSGNTGIVLDKAELSVDIANPPSGFDTFAVQYGLSGVKTDDDDADGLNDWGEYVFGGNPTNSNDIGTQPSFEASSGIYTFTLIGDNTVTAHVLTNLNLVVGQWGTHATVSITATDGILSNYTEGVGTAADQTFIKLIVE